MPKSLTMILLCSALLWGAFKEEDAHEHGKVSVTVAVAADEMEIALQSPLFNIAGFEHEAHTAKERTLLKKQTRMLQDPGALYQILPLKSCRFIRADREGEADHEADHHEKHAHQDIESIMLFRCTQKLQGIDFQPLFTTFPLIESLHLEWIIESRQGSLRLDKKATLWSLRR